MIKWLLLLCCSHCKTTQHTRQSWVNCRHYQPALSLVFTYVVLLPCTLYWSQSFDGQLWLLYISVCFLCWSVTLIVLKTRFSSNQSERFRRPLLQCFFSNSFQKFTLWYPSKLEVTRDGCIGWLKLNKKSKSLMKHWLLFHTVSAVLDASLACMQQSSWLIFY